MMAGQDLLTNPIFGFVFVWMWVGLVPISLLLGQFWRATNPLRTIHRGLCALARVDPEQGLVTLPSRVGVWPAAAGLFGFAWLELVQPDRTTLAVLRVWALAWLVILVLGAIVFGQRWIGAADPFEVYCEHARPDVDLAAGRRSAEAGQPAGWPERLARSPGSDRCGSGAARQYSVRQLYQHQLVDRSRAELQCAHSRVGYRRPAGV